MPTKKEHFRNNRERVRIHRVTHYDDGEFQQAGKFEWCEAADKLTYGGFKLWMWLADNSNGYEFDLSPTAIKNALHMPDNTYCRAKKNLIDNGYLVLAEDGRFNYYMYGRPDWHLGDNPYFQNGSIKYLDASKMEGTFTSKMEGKPNKDTSKMEGDTSKMEGDTSKMEGDNPNLLPKWGDKYTTDIQETDLYTEGRPSDTLDGNSVSTGRHPSGSSEHSSSAECPTDTAPPKAGLKPAKKKDGNRRRMPNELAIQEKKEIAEGYREGTMEYPDMYDRYNVKKGTLNYEKILEFESEIAEYDKNKEKNVIISQLENQPDKLAKLSEYSGCSIEEVKENVSKFRLNPDMLIDCFESDSGYIYKHDYWLEKYKNQHTYWDWINKCYDLQYNTSLNSSSVVGSSSYSVKTENFDDVIDDTDLVNTDDADSIENIDYNSMTDEQLSKLIDSWL